jgi:hypothetical protein
VAAVARRGRSYDNLRFVGRLSASGLLVTGLVACGPSFQAVYEGDVHFEHCNALDEGSASVEAKKECWRDWLHDYTYGQSRDRVEYGGTRYSELSLDPTLPREDVKDGSSRPSKRIVAGPVPTNAFEPPPNVIDGHQPLIQSASLTLAHAPGSDCADGCGQRWTTCRAGCRDGACDACDQTYRACMPGCFREDSGIAPARSSR